MREMIRDDEMIRTEDRFRLYDWYDIDDNRHIIRIENLFHGSSTKATNCYIFASGNEALIVDPGMANDDMGAKVAHVLDQLQIDYTQVSFFMTHLHIDHSDFAVDLVKKGVTIRALDKGRDFLEAFTSPTYIERSIERYAYEGLSDEVAPEIALTYSTCLSKFYPDDIAWVTADSTFDIGAFHFQVIDTRGHTPGCASLFETQLGLLVSGDFLLDHPTPLTTMPELTNPLGTFFEGLARVKTLPVTCVMPAHGLYAFRLLPCLEQEIEGRKTRLLRTLHKISQAGIEGTIGLYAMSSVAQLPLQDGSTVAQNRSRWGTTTNSIAYLEYLTYEGLVSRNERDGKALYTITSRGKKVLEEFSK